MRTLAGFSFGGLKRTDRNNILTQLHQNYQQSIAI